MAGWALNNHKLSSRAMDENDMLMGALRSQKSGIDLLQNCDLPPPLKVFSGSDKAALSSMNKAFSLMGREEINDFDIYEGERGGENEKLEILKALRLSQTRAREAEKKAAILIKEKDSLRNALLRESMQLLAYRQWVRFLEVQVSKLQSEIKLREEKWRCSCGGGISNSDLLKERRDCEDGDDGFSWFAALAMCLGVAFGFRYLF